MPLVSHLITLYWMMEKKMMMKRSRVFTDEVVLKKGMMKQLPELEDGCCCSSEVEMKKKRNRNPRQVPDVFLNEPLGYRPKQSACRTLCRREVCHLLLRVKSKKLVKEI